MFATDAVLPSGEGHQTGATLVKDCDTTVPEMKLPFLNHGLCNPTDISASPRNNGAALPTPLLQQKGLVACYQQKITEDNLYSE